MSVEQKLLVGLASIVHSQAEVLVNDGWRIVSVNMDLSPNSAIFLALLLERNAVAQLQPKLED